LTANNVLLGNGTSAVQFVPPGSNGNVLTSNGTTWTSAAAGGGRPTGTAMLFFQAAAPTGWTQVTTQNNKALRVVSGTGGGTGGSVAFTTAFASQSVAGTVGSTTLTTAQMPSHSHTSTTYQGFSSKVAGPTSVQFNPNGQAPTFALPTTNTGSSNSHDHTFSGTAIDLAVQYIDLIIATKD
jgi:hypothetical protein